MLVPLAAAGCNIGFDGFGVPPDLTLSVEATVLRLADGAPVEGALVFACGYPSWCGPPAATTDAEGRATLSDRRGYQNLCPYHVRVEAEGLVAATAPMACTQALQRLTVQLEGIASVDVQPSRLQLATGTSF